MPPTGKTITRQSSRRQMGGDIGESIVKPFVIIFFDSQSDQSWVHPTINEEQCMENCILR